jgi:hypothetical protein
MNGNYTLHETNNESHDWYTIWSNLQCVWNRKLIKQGVQAWTVNQQPLSVFQPCGHLYMLIQNAGCVNISLYKV